MPEGPVENKRPPEGLGADVADIRTASAKIEYVRTEVSQLHEANSVDITRWSTRRSLAFIIAASALLWLAIAAGIASLAGG